MPMAYCRVLLCNINKKSSCCNGGFLVISNKYLVTFHFLLAIYLYSSFVKYLLTNPKWNSILDRQCEFATTIQGCSSSVE